ncbi:MAG: YfiM family protein [Myxococcota bacterium]|nr:YfiM family protein [Myxococcota bacterium]
MARAPSPQELPPAPTPWIDLGPTPVLTAKTTPPTKGRRLAAPLTLAGLYAGFIGWTYFAWYRRPSHEFRWADPAKDGTWKIWSKEGWFGTRGYAGGADKMGHAWATLALARAGTEMLNQWGGYSRLTSAIVGTSLSQALFLGVEIRDGTSYAFSPGDFVFNTLGAGLAFAQSMWPAVDEAVDFRVEYVPSPAYRARARAKSDVDLAEDYSGQTYHLAFHLGAIDRLAGWRYGRWAPYVDLTFGFETRGYKPDPLYKPNPTQCMEDGTLCDFAKERNLFVGLSVNVQGVFDRLLTGRSEGLRKFLHGGLEVFSVPYTTLRMATQSSSPTGEVPDE